MKLVHSEAMLAQFHSNIWMITVLDPDGARVVTLSASGAAATRHADEASARRKLKLEGSFMLGGSCKGLTGRKGLESRKRDLLVL
jgi:hypothetical protein